jgi:hypothetical protein
MSSDRNSKEYQFSSFRRHVHKTERAGRVIDRAGLAAASALCRAANTEGWVGAQLVEIGPRAL